VTPAEFEKDLVSLRTEIVECLKTRIDLLKYKLLIIAILASIGLGLTDKIDVEKAVIAPIYLLCIIPFACVFVDSLCMHNNLRILVIARFLQTNGNLYECFVSDIREYSTWIFSLEDCAVHISSIIVSVILIIIGYYKDSSALKITGFFGFIVIIIVYLLYYRLRNGIAEFKPKPYDYKQVI
jgi:hypothetical protein